MSDLVSVVTATWDRHSVLLERCMPSVQSQTYDRLEHIIVSDGPDNALAEKIAAFGVGSRVPIRFFQLGCNWQALSGGHDYGAHPRLAGTLLAAGEYIAYLDDDNEYLPFHIENLVAGLRQAAASMAWGRAEVRGARSGTVGDGRLEFGHIDTSLILHRREILALANWQTAGYGSDWDIVERWIHAGVVTYFVEETSVIYHARG